MHNDWIEKKIFIVVKTNPNSSKKYQETLCTAGITDDGDWIRLYPINFRSLDDGKKYKNYSWVKTRIKPASEALSGKRVDSYTPDLDRWEVISEVGTKLHWSERKNIVYPTRSKSLEELQVRLEKEKRSLGIFKPKEILDFQITRNDHSSRANREKIIQQDLFTDNLRPLESIPYDFRYQFKCDHPLCKGHTMIDLEWDIYAAYLKWKRIYGEKKDFRQD